VLSGRNSSHGIDAALFLTAIRLACEPREPYFSLDPDGPSWGRDGEVAFEALWSRIKNAYAPDLKSDRGEKPGSTVDLKVVSASRDYPDIWREIEARHPHFRSKLVFSPEWMRETRFGEILYKADVLLKELSSGGAILSKGRLRASSVKGYLAA